jgi:hypothetical protein
LAYLFAFQFSEHTNSKDEVIKGIGISGFWIGLIVGMIHQIVAYICLISLTSWTKVYEISDEGDTHDSNPLNYSFGDGNQLNSSFVKGDQVSEEDLRSVLEEIHETEQEQE